MMDVQGVKVEKYKIPRQVDKILGGIRSMQKKIRNFTVVKALVEQRLAGQEQQLMTQSKMLFESLPKEKLNNLQGMNFTAGVQEAGPQQDLDVE
jgi:hypothetical protein